MIGVCSRTSPRTSLRSNSHRETSLSEHRPASTCTKPLKYPEDRNKQMAILQQWSPKEAAELGRESSWQPAMRSDWDEVRHAIMDWVVRYKWLSYQLLINRNLDTTAGRPIVEVSPVDAYWGAIPQPNGELVGANVLGKIWMQVRKELEDGPPVQARDLHAVHYSARHGLGRRSYPRPHNLRLEEGHAISATL